VPGIGDRRISLERAGFWVGCPQLLRNACVTISCRGGTHGKSKGVNIPGIRSESRENEFSETAPELRQGARSSRPFEKLSRETHSFRCRAEEDQFGSESTLGKKNLERLSNYGETQAQIVSGCQKEDRSGAAGKVG